MRAGLKAALLLAELGPKLGGQPLPAERLFDAVNVILSYQNHDGGWATYENTRSFHALEVGTPRDGQPTVMSRFCYYLSTQQPVSKQARVTIAPTTHMPSC